MYLHFRFLSVRTVGFIDFGYSLKFHPSQRVPAPVAPAWNMPNSIQRDTDKKGGWPMEKIASYCFDIEGAKGTGITDAYHATA